MKISLNWMKWYGGQGLDAPIDELVERIGSQLGAVEAVENLGEKYQGIIVAKVVSCTNHPNADRLHVCKIDDGGKAEDVERDENGHVQVVCGAPNVREGLLVAWLPPGSTVPESVGKDPFVLEARELRGVISNGMLASPKELALGDSHEGILEIDEAAKPGESFAKAYGLDDYIIDIENKMFTHRPDCFGQLGVAREIAGITGNQFISPDWYKTAQHVEPGEGLPLEVRNELPELVPRFMAVALSSVTIKPSPGWLQTYLLRVGVRPINNVVDITNYLMLLTGQPLHAYDYDKVKAGADKATLVVRYSKTGEKVALLNGKEIEPRSEAVMIATESKLIGVGGVMGGSDTEVDENTKNIILECATFDMYSIRRTAMAHGLFTDAVTRFNKGQSPLQNDRVISKAVQLTQELAGATTASQLLDDNRIANRQWVHPPVPITLDFINTRLGLALDAPYVRSLLEHVEFTVEQDGERITVTAPFWRTDIETREDVVEEVGRLHGFDKLPLELPKRSIKPVQKDPLLEFKRRIRENLVKAGANEVLSYSFVHGDLLKKVGQNPEHAFQVSNALSPDLQYYRLSLTPSLLTSVHPNIKAGYDSFALFELGKVHYLGEMDVAEPEVPNEDNHLALIVAYHDKHRPAGAPYYHVRKYLERIVDLEKASLSPLAEFDLATDEWGRQLTAPYDPTRSAVIVKDGQIWGVVGEFTPSARRALKLPAFAAGFEVHLDMVAGHKLYYRPLPRFPKVTQDMTLKVPADLPYQQLFDFVWSEFSKIQPEHTFLQLWPIDIYQREDDTAYKQVTLRLTIANYEKTMTDTEVAKLLDTVAETAHAHLQAERV